MVVEWEGPASLGQEVHLTFAQPVKTRYLFIQVRCPVITLLPCRDCPQAGLSTNGRWGFSEVKVFTGLYGLAYCTNNNPLNGIEAGNKTAPSVS